MDLRFSEADEAFRRDVHAWLAERLAGPFAEVRGRGGPGREYEAVDARIAWEQELGAGGFIGMAWPRDAGGRDLTLTQQLVFWEEYAALDGPGRIGVVGDWLLGPTLIARVARAAGPLPARDPGRHRTVVSRLLRARRRVGPRVAAHGRSGTARSG